MTAAKGLPTTSPRPAIFPAVDLRGGRCVRLVRGARDAEIGYGDDPVAAALRWRDEGAEWIHAIDLGGALGEIDNLQAIVAIARAVDVPVQAGGGLRDEARVARLLDGGVRRVILGTRALRDEEFLRGMVDRFGAERIVLAVDVTGETVRLKGWEEESGLDIAAGLAYGASAGVRHILVTAIDRDGTLSGPAVPLVSRVLAAGAFSVVAAGGIGTLEHIRGLLDLRHPQLEGVVVGRALYEGTVGLPDAVKLSREYRP